MGLEAGELHTSLVTTIGEQGPGKVSKALGMENQLRPENGNRETRAHSQGLSRRKADSGLPFPLPLCYFKTCPPFSPPTK